MIASMLRNPSQDDVPLVVEAIEILAHNKLDDTAHGRCQSRRGWPGISRPRRWPRPTLIEIAFPRARQVNTDLTGRLRTLAYGLSVVDLSVADVTHLRATALGLLRRGRHHRRAGACQISVVGLRALRLDQRPNVFCEPFALETCAGYSGQKCPTDFTYGEPYEVNSGADQRHPEPDSRTGAQSAGHFLR
jgi:hypothetical protein